MTDARALDGADDGADDGSRWDTPCGIHHGWTFVAGMFAGALVVAIIVYLLVVP